MIIKSILLSIKELFFPSLCSTCNKLLESGESYLCTHCRMDIPLTGFSKRPCNNYLYDLFYGRTDICGAASFFYYNRHSPYSNIVKDIKFHNHRLLSRGMSRWFARTLKENRTFENVDLIIPVPLHKKRLSQRGYNQAELIARPISEALSVRIDCKSVVRSRKSRQQAKIKDISKRADNVCNIFEVVDVDALKGKHILIVDDVITTGQTVLSLIEAIEGSVSDCKISVCSLCSGKPSPLR